MDEPRLHLLPCAHRCCMPCVGKLYLYALAIVVLEQSKVKEWTEHKIKAIF